MVKFSDVQLFTRKKMPYLVFSPPPLLSFFSSFSFSFFIGILILKINCSIFLEMSKY